MGQAPSNMIAVDQNPKTAGRTRPLCNYPTWPKYNGSGDINSAENYTCVSPIEKRKAPVQRRMD